MLSVFALFENNFVILTESTQKSEVARHNIDKRKIGGTSMEKIIRDAKGRVACIADPLTGSIEIKYSKISVQTALEIGKSLTIEREGIVTKITRLSTTAFRVVT